MNKKIISLTVSLVLFSGVLVLSGVAADKKSDKVETQAPDLAAQREQMRQEIMAQIGLTDEQKQQLNKMQEDYANKTKEVGQKLVEANKALRTELDQQNSDKKNLNKVVSNIKKIQGDMLDLRIENILDTKALLTAEQYTKLQQIEDERRKQFQANIKSNMQQPDGLTGK